MERTAFFYRAGLYLAFASIVCAVILLMDYAKIRAVVEDSRSMMGALVAGSRFVVLHPRQTIGLYLLNLAAWLIVVAVYLFMELVWGGGLLSLCHRPHLHRAAGDGQAPVRRVANRALPRASWRTLASWHDRFGTVPPPRQRIPSCGGVDLRRV